MNFVWIKPTDEKLQKRSAECNSTLLEISLVMNHPVLSNPGPRCTRARDLQRRPLGS